MIETFLSKKVNEEAAVSSILSAKIRSKNEWKIIYVSFEETQLSDYQMSEIRILRDTFTQVCFIQVLIIQKSF